LGTGLGVPLGDLFRTIAKLAAAHTGTAPVPVRPVPPPTPLSTSDLADLVVDAGAFRAVTGWCPRQPLDRTLRETVAMLSHPPSAPPP
jgi:nucleoside-diphosphate-sugar epimerase